MFKNLILMPRESSHALIPYMTVMLSKSSFFAFAITILVAIIVVFGLGHSDCWAKDSVRGAEKDSHVSTPVGSSPEKLYEAVSGYLESLHGVR
ncbi:MAG: hypothetical protein ACP5U1_13105, partial [Desulfomonilaceae bacterium]